MKTLHKGYSAQCPQCGAEFDVTPLVNHAPTPDEIEAVAAQLYQESATQAIYGTSWGLLSENHATYFRKHARSVIDAYLHAHDIEVPS